MIDDRVHDVSRPWWVCDDHIRIGFLQRPRIRKGHVRALWIDICGPGALVAISLQNFYQRTVARAGLGKHGSRRK